MEAAHKETVFDAVDPHVGIHSALRYITSDPEGMSDGFRVDFDDPNGLMKLNDVEVHRANTGNG